MIENSTEQAEPIWHMFAHQGALVFVALGIIFLVIHLFRLATTSDAKAKYDYINKSEINFLWYTSLMFIIAFVLYINTLLADDGRTFWIFIRIFLTIMFGLILGVIIRSILKFYYPFYIEKRLKKLRYKPRVSPEGNTMKLLSEDEEDVYLDEGMIAEENVFSVDYDVWKDETTGYTKIEKYQGHLHALKCSECSYQTLKVSKEEIVSKPTQDEDGELVKFYKCGYCSHKEKRNFRIAKLNPESESTSSN